MLGIANIKIDVRINTISNVAKPKIIKIGKVKIFFQYIPIRRQLMELLIWGLNKKIFFKM